MRLKALLLLCLACLLACTVPLRCVQVYAQPDGSLQLTVTCDQPYYYVKGDTVRVNAHGNDSVPATLSVYWNWRSFSDDVLIYWNTQVLNATWTIPTANAQAGFYKFVVDCDGQTHTLWRTLLHLDDWTADTLPFSHVWQGINYTLQGRNFTAQTTSDSLHIRYPTIPFQYSASFYRNNMSFLIRLQGATWSVDLLYFTCAQGVKWRINGTLANPQTFTFQCVENPLQRWRKRLMSFRSATLVFNWDDLRHAGHAFTWVNQTLSVTIPDSFDIDPLFGPSSFEGGNPEYTTDGWDSTATLNDAELWYSSTWSHCGVNSSRHNSSSTGTSRNAYALEAVVESQLNARWYMYFETLPVHSAFVYVYRLTAGGWRTFNIAIQSVSNNVSLYYFNDSASSSYITNTVWNVSEEYLVEVEFKRHATNASWSIWIDEVLVHSVQNLHNDFDTDQVIMGHFSNFRSGWLVTYYDCFVMDNAYIGPEEEEEGQNLTFTRTGILRLWASGVASRELGFLITATLQLWSAGLALRGLGFVYTATLHLHSAVQRARALAFQATATLRLWATRIFDVDLSALNLTFLVSAALRLHSSATATFQGVAFAYAFLLGDTLFLVGQGVRTAVVRGIYSNVLLVAGLACLLALCAIAIATSKRD